MLVLHNIDELEEFRMTDGDKAKMVNIKEKIRQLVSDRDYLRMLLDQVSHLDFGFEDVQKAYAEVLDEISRLDEQLRGMSGSDSGGNQLSDGLME